MPMATASSASPSATRVRGDFPSLTGDMVHTLEVLRDVLCKGGTPLESILLNLLWRQLYRMHGHIPTQAEFFEGPLNTVQWEA
jgi:hypothetical protein